MTWMSMIRGWDSEGLVSLLIEPVLASWQVQYLQQFVSYHIYNSMAYHPSNYS